MQNKRAHVQSHSLPVILAILSPLLFVGMTSAEVKLPAVFSDHAVLQAGKPVNVWGWADPGERLSVNVAGKVVETSASPDGKWTVTLPQLQAGGPHVMEVRGSNTVRVSDLLVGEVWLCAGQSNMAMQLKGLHGEVQDADAVIAKANYPTLRMFVHDRPFTIREAVVPPTEPQADRPGKWIVCTPRTAAQFTALGYFFARQLQDQLNTPVGLINSAVGGTTIESWTSLSAQQAVPELRSLLVRWQELLKEYDPVAEQRKTVAAKASWLTERAEAVTAGRAEPKAPREADYKNLAANRPAGLFNAMIAPLIPYTIRGAIWYQGERNASGEFTSLYGRQLETMIADWRTRWNDAFYMTYVQLPNYQKLQVLPSEDAGWGVWVREGQREALARVAKSSMAITIDLGGATRDFLHPKNKDEFARRVALLALHDVYGKSDLLPSGPLFREARRDGGRMILTFDFSDGLAANHKDKQLKGFAIAGIDRKFVWADAEIRDGRIIVWSDRVSEPEAVRYSWASNPIGNLENRAHLPCSPFRTDAWPVMTASENLTD